jgi:3-oxoacyl-[acyl-carrier protein] reductase
MTGTRGEDKPPVVVITGASQGIGAEIAKLFSREVPGVSLALLARNEATLREVQGACAAESMVNVYPCDVSDADRLEAVLTQLRDDMGSPDVLINNAGTWHGEAVQDMTPADFDRVIASNLRSTYLLCHYLLPGMLALGRGDIFNMASTAAFEGYAGVSAYCAAKHGVAGFTKALREEVREHNIRVSCISPGPTWSPSWHNTGVPEEKLMPAEDVARAFLNIYNMDRNVVTEDIVLRPRSGHIVSN